ncbi:tetratricopeptide repeat protein [Legionella sp. 227]|uniref:tetratricopeptide repeat protein n=1 Tax=Legionella sp. 227 TaxID=3367288 RepID=UPI00370DA813
MSPELKEIIEKLIQEYPSDYTEMHAKKTQWNQLIEQLSKAEEYIKLLQTEKEESSIILLGQLAHNLGVFNTHVVSNYPRALELFKIALEAKQATDVPPESRAFTHAHLADCAYRNGNTVLGIIHFEEANQRYKQAKDHKDTDLARAFVLHAAGNAYYNVGAYSKSLALFSEARELRLKHLPEDDIDFGYLEHDQADVWTALGEYQFAAKLFQSSLEKKKKYFENDHTNIALLYQCQALLFIKNNQLTEAETNLKWAYAIYAKHAQHSASEVQPDLLRNYFYSILLQLAADNFAQAKDEIVHFKSQVEAIKDKTHSAYVRLAQVNNRLLQYQNQPKEALKQLEETISNFIPRLDFNSARELLTVDNKFDVASLISEYAIELFIQNGYQNFDDTLKLIKLALQLKEDFYQSLPMSNPPLGTISFAFSDYDLGLLYYLAALASNNSKERQEKLITASQYVQSARDKLIQVGLNKNHINLLACTTQLNKIEEILKPNKQETETLHQTLMHRIMFFTSAKKMENAQEEHIPYLDTILRDYP